MTRDPLYFELVPTGPLLLFMSSAITMPPRDSMGLRLAVRPMITDSSDVKRSASCKCVQQREREAGLLAVSMAKSALETREGSAVPCKRP